MTKEKAYQIALDFAQSLPTKTGEVKFTGIIDSRFVFHVERDCGVGHFGFPIFCSIGGDGDVREMLPPEVFKAMDMCRS